MLFKGIPCTVNTLHDFIEITVISCNFFLAFRFPVNDFTPFVKQRLLKMIFGTVCPCKCILNGVMD